MRRRAMTEWLSHLQSGDGGDIEVGVVWDPNEGWRAYVRVGSKALCMGAGQARKMARICLRELSKPENVSHRASMGPIFAELGKIANEVRRKNRERVVPDPILAAAPSAGSA